MSLYLAEIKNIRSRKNKSLYYISEKVVYKYKDEKMFESVSLFEDINNSKNNELYDFYEI